MRIWIIVLSVVLFSCQKRADIIQPLNTPGSLSIHISYGVDIQQLSWNNMVYKNEAGNEYSISKCQYYLSDFRFYKNERQIQQIDSVFYIDANTENTNTLFFQTINAEKYDSIAFCIGVAPLKNIAYGLPATINNTNMIWPEMMGGGYHFIKLEGHWKYAMGIEGFAMHVGKNGFQGFTGIKCNVTVKSNMSSTLTMKMNINEWFKVPNTYNFATDGVYSMGNETLMQKIMQNGIDVFSVQ